MSAAKPTTGQLAAHGALTRHNPILSFCPRCEEWVRFLDEVRLRDSEYVGVYHIGCRTACIGILNARLHGFGFRGCSPLTETVQPYIGNLRRAPRKLIREALAKERAFFTPGPRTPVAG